MTISEHYSNVDPPMICWPYVCISPRRLTKRSAIFPTMVVVLVCGHRVNASERLVHLHRINVFYDVR